MNAANTAPDGKSLVLPRCEEHLEALESGLRASELLGAGQTGEFARGRRGARHPARGCAPLARHPRQARPRDEPRRALRARPARARPLGYGYLSSLGFFAPSLARCSSGSLERTGRARSIGVLAGDDVVFVQRAEARRLVRIDIGVGTGIPGWLTSRGRVLLAALPDAEVDARRKAARLERLTRYTVTDKRRLRKILLEVRRRGWRAIADEIAEGICGLAAPLRDRAGRTIAATNMSLGFARSGRAALRAPCSRNCTAPPGRSSRACSQTYRSPTQAGASPAFAAAHDGALARARRPRTPSSARARAHRRVGTPCNPRCSKS